MVGKRIPTLLPGSCIETALSNSHYRIWSGAVRSCLRRPQPLLDRTTAAIENTHEINLFLFLKVIAVARGIRPATDN